MFGLVSSSLSYKRLVFRIYKKYNLMLKSVILNPEKKNLLRLSRDLGLSWKHKYNYPVTYILTATYIEIVSKLRRYLDQFRLILNKE